MPLRALGRAGLCLSLSLAAWCGGTPASPNLQACGLLNIPYVPDGALDERGRWTWFSRQDQVQDGPGLNCSGFTIALAGRLLGRSLTLAQATRDRLGDSGPGAPLGPDWDFGWDLVMNLSEGLPRQVITPGGRVPVSGNGQSLRGFPLDDASAWLATFTLLRPDRIYLASISRDLKGHRVQHYHTAILLQDEHRRVWFYQTLPHGRSHRLDLSSAAGFERMLGMFGAGKRILILEVEPLVRGN